MIDFTPAYLKMDPAFRRGRIDSLRRLFESCSFCPRRCRVNRPAGEEGLCGAAAALPVSSFGPHFGEERELVGRGGSGTIFFIHCNLECLFCQNWTISRAAERGESLTIDELAGVMINLQKRGCSNINLVTPTPYLYQIASAIDRAAAAGLHLPVVYNCGGYEAAAALRLMEGFIDIYMPDAKYGSDAMGAKYSGVPDYFSRLRQALPEMQRQVGDLVIDEDGLARRGLLVRHLVMPEKVAGSAAVSRFLKEEVSPRCAVNVMAQYYPACRAEEFPPLHRRITSREFREAAEYFSEAGLRLL